MGLTTSHNVICAVRKTMNYGDRIERPFAIQENTKWSHMVVEL